MYGRDLWDRHPHVRSHGDLSLGERAADRVKAGLGSWEFIFAQTTIVALWIALNIIGFMHHWDAYPFILLNLLFSTQAAYAAPILQLSQNRNDRVSAEVATGTLDNSKKLLGMSEEMLTLQKQQMELLGEIKALRELIETGRKRAAN